MRFFDYLPIYLRGDDIKEEYRLIDDDMFNTRTLDDAAAQGKQSDFLSICWSGKVLHELRNRHICKRIMDIQS